jgi:hypothetical protein
MLSSEELKHLTAELERLGVPSHDGGRLWTLDSGVLSGQAMLRRLRHLPDGAGYDLVMATLADRGEATDLPAHDRPRLWPHVVLAAAALAGGLFSIAGFVMAADFTVADSSHLAHWQGVAKVYLALTVIAALLLCAALLGLRRARRPQG